MTIDFSSYNIGLKRGEVALVPHNSEWSSLFLLESSRILSTFNAYLPKLKFHHIGSTAIKDILAKPIIDMLGEIDDIESIDQFRQIFIDLGYEYKGEYGISGRRYLTLYDTKKEVGYVHIHIFESASEEIKKHLLFRDLLNANAELRLEYQKLKLSLVGSNIPRSEYSPGKAELITRILNSSSN